MSDLRDELMNQQPLFYSIGFLSGCQTRSPASLDPLWVSGPSWLSERYPSPGLPEFRGEPGTHKVKQGSFPGADTNSEREELFCFEALDAKALVGQVPPVIFFHMERV